MDYGNQGRRNVLDEFGKTTLEPILKEIWLSISVDTFIYTTVFGTYGHLTLLQPFSFVHRIQWGTLHFSSTFLIPLPSLLSQTSVHHRCLSGSFHLLEGRHFLCVRSCLGWGKKVRKNPEGKKNSVPSPSKLISIMWGLLPNKQHTYKFTVFVSQGSQLWILKFSIGIL